MKSPRMPPRRRVAMSLGGTDRAGSGIGVCVTELLPRLAAALDRRAIDLTVIGTPAEIAAYPTHHLTCHALPAWLDRPGVSAAHAMVRLGSVAASLGAEALLLPAANRRAPLWSAIPTVGIVHDLAQLHVPEKYDPLRMHYLHRWLLPAIGRIDQLVAVSDATRRDLQQAMGRDAEVVPNGVDVGRFATPPEVRREVPARLGLERPYILYVSRLEHPGKNHLRLVQAFARSGLAERMDLVLAGKDWGAGPLIDAEVGALGLPERVHRLGFVGDDDLPGLVGGAEVVTMVGLREGFGLPALEALAAGRPVVASKTGALPEVVGPWGELCDPYDVDDIRRALERSAGDEVRRRVIATEGPAHAALRDWSVSAERLAELLALTITTGGRR